MVLASGALEAQSIASRVSQRGKGIVRMSFPAREGVCPGGAGGRYSWNGGYSWGGISLDPEMEEWDNGCRDETVLVAISVKNGKPNSIRTYVGGKWKTAGDSITDLGAVTGEAAAKYLFSVAIDSPYVDHRGAIYPASLAAGVNLWPDVLRIVEDTDRPKELRKVAISWLGRSGGDKVTSALESILVDETESNQLREAALSGLASRPGDAGFNALIRYVKNGKDGKLRASAMSHLARQKDPRITALLEEMVGGK